jgi:hypothetical protein
MDLMLGRLALLGILVIGALAHTGCEAFRLAGAMAQADEDQKLIEVLPKYDGLENHSVAVIVDADMSTLYEHPYIVAKIATELSARIGESVPGCKGKIQQPQAVINWQYRTPQWNALPFGELAEQLNVDRVVHIDILEYRLNPPGNRYLWEGVCNARIGIIERGGIDPDTFIQTFDIAAKYPTVNGVGRESASQVAIETGLQYTFVQKVGWLFYKHEEPKHPDRYRPELNRKS